MSDHARLSPSSAERWFNCPGSANMELLYKDVSSDAAIDGTGSHLLLELCIEQKRDAESFIGEIIGVNSEDKPNGWVVRKDRAERVQVALDYIKDKCVQSESRSDLGVHYGRGDLYGTADITYTTSFSVLGEEFVKYVEIIDYKDGRQFVSEKRNKQLIIYLAGKVLSYQLAEDCEFAVTIIQPKTKPMIRTWRLSYDTLMAEVKDIIKAAEATDTFDAPLVRGDWCHYCKHKPNCDSEVGLSFLDKSVGDMTASEIAKALDQEKIILDKYKLIKEEAEKRISSGDKVVGYAMRPGKGSNGFIGSDKEIVEQLKGIGLTPAKIYDKKVKSYSALKKLKLTPEQANALDELNHYTQGSPKLTKVKGDTFKDLFSEYL